MEEAQVKEKTVGQVDESSWRPAWEAFGICVLLTESALGWQALPGPQKVEPCNFLRVLTVFSSKLSRTWLCAQAAVHSPLNCLSINILPGTISGHAR